jgi:hypothetical protein
MRYGCAIIAGYLIFFLIASLIAESLFGDFGAILVRILAIVAGFLVLPPIFRGIRMRRREEAPSASEILAKDHRAPILYLRSFTEDGSREEVPPFQMVTPLISSLGAVNDQTATYEEGLASKLESLGPFVALSNLKYGPPELGAARLHTEDDSWQAALEDLLERCQLVIFRAGETASLLWELERLVAFVSASKVIVYLQVGVEKDKAVQQARYKKFKSLAEPILPHALPETRGKNDFLHFTPAWEPVLSRKLRDVLTQKGLIFERSLIRYKLKKNLPLAHNTTPIHKPLSNPNPILKTVLITIAGIFLAALFGSLYGLFFNTISPGLIFDGLVFIAATLLTGGITGLIGRALKAPGSKKYLIIGLIAAVAFIYAKWVSWAYFLAGGIVLNPTEMYALIFVFFEILERLGEIAPGDDVLLWFIWLIEAVSALVIITITTWVYGLSDYEYNMALADTDPSYQSVSPQMASNIQS